MIIIDCSYQEVQKGKTEEHGLGIRHTSVLLHYTKNQETYIFSQFYLVVVAKKDWNLKILKTQKWNWFQSNYLETEALDLDQDLVWKMPKGCKKLVQECTWTSCKAKTWRNNEASEEGFVKVIIKTNNIVIRLHTFILRINIIVY